MDKIFTFGLLFPMGSDVEYSVLCWGFMVVYCSKIHLYLLLFVSSMVCNIKLNQYNWTRNISARLESSSSLDKVNCVQQRSVITVMTNLIKTQSWPDKGGRCSGQAHSCSDHSRTHHRQYLRVLPSLCVCLYLCIPIWGYEGGMGPGLGEYWHLPPNVDTRESC